MQRTAHSALSITPAFSRRFVYGLALVAALAGLCGLFVVLLSVASSRSRPQAPALELKLELAQTKWHANEFLWYRLEIANVGKSIAPIYDHFWVHQNSQETNWEREQGTYFQITDAQGKEVYAGTTEVFLMWENDNSRYTPPYRQGIRGFLYYQVLGRLPSTFFWPLFGKFFNKWDKPGDVPRIRDEPVLLLRPGARFAATPSVVKDFDPSSRDPRRREGDPRLIPDAPSGWSREQVEQLKLTWKRAMEDSHLWGTGAFERPPLALPPPKGFRVLEGNVFRKPGKYRIKVIFNTRAELPSLSAEEEIANWKKSHKPWNRGQLFEKDTIKKWETITSADLEKIRERRGKIEAENKNEVYLESNAFEIEVVQ
jgi:hypothetical protein